MGLSRDSRHKRRLTGGRKVIHIKKRKYELARPSANTKLGAKNIKEIRTRGGNKKFRALRLDAGNFSWGSEVTTRKTRILDVVYNSSSNELLRTKTLVKGAVIQIDATPFRQWYETHYATAVGIKDKKEREARKAALSEGVAAKSKKVQKKFAKRLATRELDVNLADQFNRGRLLAVISSRPGQSGRADGYVLEGPELEFYLKKLSHKKRH
jgi:small subunit ribosomal protein S8e